MPNDFPISPTAPNPSVNARQHAAPRAPPAAHPTHIPDPALPNPSLRLDPALGLVVIEFRNERGGVAASFPTERQLAAYRASAITGRASIGPHAAPPPELAHPELKGRGRG